MADTMQCFAIEELEELTSHQLELLRNATLREVHDNPEIRRILGNSKNDLASSMCGRRAADKVARVMADLPAPACTRETS
jgi:hypothetical protein